MSSRSNLRPQAVIGTGSSPSVSGSMAASITSNPTVLQSLTVGLYTYSWSGTSPVGAISVQISNDYSLNPNGTVNNTGTWVTIYFTLNGTTVTNSAPLTGNTGEGAIEWTTGAYAIRTVYTRTSGTGTIQAIVNGKVS